jgi:predicted Rossmann fold nucleotide-binding protein DprA/Smf involved in DNA uptake
LLLTAPLIVSGEESSAELFTPAEYRKFELSLSKLDLQPADLLDDVERLRDASIDIDRVKRLLGRGFQLSQAIESWQARAIWIVSTWDEFYPQRLKTRLTTRAPVVIYGCGKRSLFDLGGLAVVGSRAVDNWLVEYTLHIGELASQAGVPVVSGGARGIDQAAMRGALEAGGKAIGVLADSLGRAALNREHRDLLMDGQLVLISSFDPSAGFNVGHAMQRNKFIYALSDLSLVVNSDLETGGTWAGAVEQLEKLHFVPVYVRSTGEIGEGLTALERKGALPWPNPATSDEFLGLLNEAPTTRPAEQLSLL